MRGVRKKGEGARGWERVARGERGGAGEKTQRGMCILMTELNTPPAKEPWKCEPPRCWRVTPVVAQWAGLSLRE